MKKIVKKYTKFIPQIRSRHPSHDGSRRALPLMPFRSVIRFGSTTECRDTAENGGTRIEINSREGIRNSSNKRIMKKRFLDSKVRTALWFIYTDGQLVNQISQATVTPSELPFPIIAKKHYGSKGEGNTKLDNIEEYRSFVAINNINNLIFEKFYNYNREYRLHVTEDGCFYACRKLMKRTTPDSDKWYKNDNNCVWAIEENPDFDRPANWEEVETECVKALKALKLDFAAIDLRIQSATNEVGERRTHPNFIVVEANSAPGLARIGTVKYKQILPVLLMKKYKKQR